MNGLDLRNALFIITRPDESGQTLTARYLADGYEAVHLAVMEYKIDSNLPITTIEQKITAAPGLAFTSANGVRAFTKMLAKNHRSGDNAITLDKKYIFAVGPMTAAAIQEKLAEKIHPNRASPDGASDLPGLKNIIVAGGNVEELAKAIIATYKNHAWPKDKNLLHIGAAATAGEGQGTDLVSRLRMAHIPAEKIALYDMVAVDAMPSNVVQKISHYAARARRVILFFSPRTVALTAALLRRHGFAPADFFAQCHSAAVAAAARDAGFLLLDRGRGLTT
ncbi:MAG: uroporphyrinogen-III synthase [Hydrotalea sp.]|nr:uroporphyrinogen-III synthase [Hydrotalea sp.]MDI9314474.1 uroporphyrinogen-III synthase [Hydrotalea sp.]